MTALAAEWFLATWARIPKPAAAELDGHAVACSHHAVHAAIDVDSRPHLLIEVPRTAKLLGLRPARALRVVVEKLAVGAGAPALYVDLSCTHPAHDATFAALAAELVKALDASSGDACTTVVRTVDRWRAFWAADTSGLNAEEVAGLFGELWFLDRWMSPLDAAGISTWHGPDRSRHDVQWKSHSVEIKTSARQGDGGVVHRITSLEQLDDPEQGELHLFSLHLVDDALARNTLPMLVEKVRAQVLDPAALELLDGKLAAWGYTPAHAGRYTRAFRILSEAIYRVGTGFPRLTRASFVPGIPPGVAGISYTLAMAACEPFRLASAPSEMAWLAIRATVL